MNESVYMAEEGYPQLAEEAAPPFGAGIGADVGGEFHIDGTPLRLSVIVIAAVLLLIVYHQGNFRWHVTL